MELESQWIEQTDKKWFIMLPNLYDESDLDPYEFRLLAHYIRRGDCWESVRTTATICQMSHPSVIEKRRSLESKGFIKTEVSEVDTIRVTVIDKWKENFDKYSGSQATGVVATLNGGGSQVALKNNHIKNNNQKREERTKIEMLYEDVFGSPKPMMRDILREIEKQYPMDRIEEAFLTAGRNGANSFSYVRSILEDKKREAKYNKANKDKERTTEEGRRRYGAWETK